MSLKLDKTFQHQNGKRQIMQTCKRLRQTLIITRQASTSRRPAKTSLHHPTTRQQDKAFTRTYDFLATILPYGIADWEKLSIFLNFLISKLPAPKEEDLAKGILEAIDMDSYGAEKKATMAIVMPDANSEIGPVPTAGGGSKPEPELDKLSNIIRAFNDQFGGLFADSQRIEKRITEEIPAKVAADVAYQNAKKILINKMRVLNMTKRYNV